MGGGPPLLRPGEEIFRDRCSGAVWELGTVRSFALQSLFFLGEVAALRGRLERLLAEAVNRGDRLSEADFSNFGGTLARLGSDDPGEARCAWRRSWGAGRGGRS